MRPEPFPIEWPEPTPSVVDLPPPPPPEPERKWRRWVIPTLAGFVGAVLALAGAAVIWNVARGDATVAPTTIPTTERVVVTEILTPESLDVSTQAAAAARRVIPSVVTVQITDGARITASGSGVILDEENGYIVTNQHVIESEPSVDIVLADGRRYQGIVLGTDILTDLAVVRIDADGLTAIETGSTDDLMIGDGAVAIGNPLGLGGGPTVTVGVLSAFDRMVQGDTVEEDLFGMLQTDAPFTRGSSGGALVDLEGKLIGITTAVGVSDLGAEGLGFATPVEVMRRVTAEIIESGASRHAFLGIEGATSLAVRDDGGQIPVGVLVSRLVADSSAGASGVLEGDIITTVDGTPVRTMEQLISRLRRFSPGEQISLELERDGEPIVLEFLLGERSIG